MKEFLLNVLATSLLFLIASVLMGVSAILPYMFVKYVYAYGNIYLTIISAFIGYFMFGVILMVLTALVVRIFRIMPKEGKYKIGSLGSFIWLLNAGFISLVRFTFLPFTRSNINIYFYKLLGAKIGKNVIINSTVIYDPHLLEIGDNTVIGGDAVVIAHSGEKGYLTLKKVKIGKNVSIGQYTTILPGAKIKDGAIIGAMSLVPKNKTITKGVWGGVPVRRIK